MVLLWAVAITLHVGLWMPPEYWLSALCAIAATPFALLSLWICSDDAQAQAIALVASCITVYLGLMASAFYGLPLISPDAPQTSVSVSCPSSPKS